MGIRFNKSIKIGNFLKVNVSRNGLSLTAGKRGASVNIGKRGTYLNLSPSAVGITGTGLSYRQKISGSLFNNKKKESKQVSAEKKTSALKKKEEKPVEALPDYADILREYEENKESLINLHKYTDDVMSKSEFADFVDSLDNEAKHQIYANSILGDEDTIENLVSSFMKELKLPYDVRVNYELEDNVLYVDLDLPEIEDLDGMYPSVNNYKLTYRKLTSTQLREIYARLVMSLSVFLSANYFNVSSYIDMIVISGFTTVRDRQGDLVDQYLFSVKFTREEFEKTKLEKLDDLYGFIMNFENRINLSKNYAFKAVKPYETETVMRSNELAEEALEALKGLGYKASQLNLIADRLKECQYESSAEYLKAGLMLLNEEK
ncbi:MAG: DUF4236 domain-containing protein [Erysipelotrichaceae bacterium]|nr:DUF4236 domain-containing protein [Erysipelotrichaceae bacterium]